MSMIGRKLKAIVLTIGLILLFCGTALAQQDDPTMAEHVAATAEVGRVPLGRHLQILEDPSGELTIEDVSSAEFAERFTPNEVEVPNFGFTDSAYWVRLSLDNQSAETAERLLEAGFANMHFVDLYTPVADGEGYTVKQTGALRPPDARDVVHPRMVFKVAVPPQTEKTFYLRFQSGASMALPFTLWMPEEFRLASQQEQILRGLFFGALFVLMVYNLFLLLSLRERSYLFLVILLASMIVFESGYVGYTGLYILPSAYRLRLYSQPFSFSLVFISMLLFTDAFLALRTRFTKLHWLIYAAVGVWGVLMILTPAMGYPTTASLMVPLALPSLVIVLTAGTISWIRGFRYTRFFMIAWSGLLVAFFFTVLTRLDVIPSTVVGENIYHLGLLWMAVFWSFALADRVNLLQAETEEANRALHASEDRLSQILEALPLGVIVYGTDQKPQYLNQHIVEIFSNPAHDIGPDLSAERTLTRAMEYYSVQVAGSGQPYPLDKMPIYQALLGESASVDDAEIDLIDRRVPLEIWAAPIKGQGGNVESAVVAIHDITRRKRMESERDEYRNHLEQLVAQRTAERKNLEDALLKLAEWLSAVGRIQRSLGESAEPLLVDQELLRTIGETMGAETIFTCMWERQENEAQILCCRRSGATLPHPNLAPIILPVDLSPRREMEQHEVIFVPADRSSPLLAPLETCLDDVDIHSVVLVPIEWDSTIIGLLGLGLQRPADTLAAEEEFLLYRMGMDLAGVAEYTRLHESARLLAAADERNRLARDLHDSVTQVLFSATLVAEVLPKIWRKDPERALKSLDNLRRLTYSGLAELRTMLLELRPGAVLNTPLSELLAQLTEALTSRTSMVFQLFLEQTPPLTDDVHAAFYRIAQESLNNVVKHAQADHVTVSLHSTTLEPDIDGHTQHEITLIIDDNGIGYASETERPGHLGLTIMQERATAIGALLLLESRLGQGTSVTLTWTGTPKEEGNDHD